jgi:hypothetical protein
MLRASPRIRRRRRRLLLGVFFLVVLVAGGSTVFLTPVLDVRSVKIAAHGQNTISVERIREAAGDLESRKANILFLSPKALEGRLTEAFPELESVSVRRDVLGLPFLSNKSGLINEVLISTKEREPIGTVCRGSDDTLNCFLFDRQGVLFRQATSSAPYVLDKRNVEHQLRYQVLNPETASRMAEIARNTIVGLTPTRLELGDIETTFITAEGWGIVLSNARPPGEQFKAGLIVLEREIGARRAELEYIDTTIKNRVYYRYRQ